MATIMRYNQKLRFSWPKFGSFLKRWYILIVLGIIYIPLIFIVLLSFNGQTDRGNININFGVPNVVNYLRLFEDNDFVNALINSLILGIIVTPITIIIGTITCFGIWRAKPFQKKAVMFASQISIINPEAITGIGLAILFVSTWIAMGMDMGFFTVVLSHISFCTPYAIVAIYPRMTKMNKNLILASYDLGHSKINTFFKITVPYLMPAILSGAALSFAMSLDDFIITNLVNGSWTTIGTAIYTTRKGIKAWVVTFGAVVILGTIIGTIIISLRKKVVARRNVRRK